MTTSLHHAYGIEAPREEGVERAKAWAREHLGVRIEANPDVVVHESSLLTVEEARGLAAEAAGVGWAGSSRVIIVAASRAYHEAQNALLKLFEEPPPGTTLFLILPSFGTLLPTLRSRLEIISTQYVAPVSDEARDFVKASREKRTAIIKKLTSGTDEESRRENREAALALVNGVEALASGSREKLVEQCALLEDIATLRGYLTDRGAPVKQILEHLSLVIPPRLG